MKKSLLLLSFLITTQLHALTFPRVCKNLLQTGCSDQSRADYRLNFPKFQSCLLAMQSELMDNPKLKHNVYIREIGQLDALPFYRIDITPKDLMINHKILLTSGIHGDEAIGPASLVSLLEETLNSEHSKNASYVIYPMLNPWGLKYCTRYNKDKRDLNRELKADSSSQLYQMLLIDLFDENFDLGLDIHEAWGKEFFLLANDTQDMSYAQRALENFPRNLLVSSPEGKYPYQKNRSSYTFYAPGVGMSQNKNTMKAFMKETLRAPIALTTEAPLGLELQSRQKKYKNFIAALVNETIKLG